MRVRNVKSRKGCEGWHAADDDRHPILDNTTQKAVSDMQVNVHSRDLHADQLLAGLP